jgi:uncharacterized membrane protein YbhN (UPF0104 family)
VQPPDPVNRLGDLAGWFGSVWDQIGTIDLRYIVLACIMQAGQTVLIGLSWRNILRASFPHSEVPTREIVAAYAAGTGLNAVLPAQAGTAAAFGLFRGAIPRSNIVTITAGAVAQNLFFAVAGIGVYAYLFLAQPASRMSSRTSFTSHLWFWFVVACLAGVLIILVGRVYWRRLRGLWAHAKDGTAILGTPMRYLREVVSLQACSYGLRLLITATFMYGMEIPVSLHNVLLIVAANSISSSFAITPGGIGAQQLLASTALRGVAPAARVTAYSLAQQTILMAFNLAFGIVMLASVFGWSQSRRVIASTRRLRQGTA